MHKHWLELKVNIMKIYIWEKSGSYSHLREK